MSAMRWLPAVGVATVLLTAPRARAEQFILFDGVYVHDGGSHKSLPLSKTAPTSWKTPVDYTNGRMYFRLEVMKKPNETTAQIYQVCMNAGNGSACGPQGKFSTTGILEWSGGIPFSYTTGTYDWTKGPYAFRGITKDTRNRNIDKGVNFDGAPDVGLYLPLTVRFTVWVVTKGATLDRTGLPPAPALGDAGSSDAGPRGQDAGTVRVDALGEDAQVTEPAPVEPDAGNGVAPPAGAPARRDAGAQPRPGDDEEDEDPGVARNGRSAGCAYGAGAQPSCVVLAALALLRLRARRKPA